MKLINLFVTAVVVAGGITSWVLWHNSQVALQEKEAALRQRESQHAELTAQNLYFTLQLAQASHGMTQGPSAELTRLRNKLESLRQQTNVLTRQKEQSRPKSAKTAPPSEMEHTEEDWEQLHLSAGAKPRDARSLGLAFIEYPINHQNQLPTNIDDLISELATMTNTFQGTGWSGTNQFEIVFQGPVARLVGLPLGSVAVVRSQPWVCPDGKERRVYGFMNGNSEMITTGEDSEWEQNHVFAPSSAPAKSP